MYAFNKHFFAQLQEKLGVKHLNASILYVATCRKEKLENIIYGVQVYRMVQNDGKSFKTDYRGDAK